MKKTTLSERLAFIKEDVSKLFLHLPDEVLDTYTEDGTTMRTILSNIEIASNENDSEPDSWRRPSNWDGEKTQNFLKEICMEEQMLRQLIMTMPLPMIHDLLEERKQEASNKRAKTKVIDLVDTLNDKKPIEFNSIVYHGVSCETEIKPSAYAFVERVARDKQGSDVFIAYSNNRNDCDTFIGKLNDGVV